MKIRVRKYLWIGTALIILMFVSTFASPFIQGFNIQRSPLSPTESVTLPEDNIIDYELTREQEVYAMRLGKTIMKFEYSTACVDCLAQKAFVESIANQFRDQVILEELARDVDLPLLTMSSYYGHKLLTNATNDEIVDAMCAVLTDPPIFCTTKNI